MRRCFLVVTLLLFGSGCTGPERPFEVGAREFPVNIILGKQSDRDPGPLPPNTNIEPYFFPGFLQPPIPRFQPGDIPTPGPSPGPCPAAYPFDSSELAASNRAPKPPVAGEYLFRNLGSFEIVGKSRGDYPPASIQKVHNIQISSNGMDYQFDIDVTELGSTTTTSYRVVNSGNQPGVFLVQVVTPGPTGGDSFRPIPEILLMPFPPPEFGTNLEDETNSATQGQYRSSGTDPINRTTMYLEGRINPDSPKLRVDACGEWIDAWDITVTDGRIESPTKHLAFTGRFAIATQYGGLVVRSEIVMSGSDLLDQVSSTKSSTINKVPAKPQ